MAHEVEHSHITRAAEKGYLVDELFKEVLLHLLVDIRDALEQSNAPSRVSSEHGLTAAIENIASLMLERRNNDGRTP